MLGGGEDYKEYDKEVQSMQLMRDFGFAATSSCGPDGVKASVHKRTKEERREGHQSSCLTSCDLGTWKA